MGFTGKHFVDLQNMHSIYVAAAQARELVVHNSLRWWLRTILVMRKYEPHKLVAESGVLCG